MRKIEAVKYRRVGKLASYHFLCFFGIKGGNGIFEMAASHFAGHGLVKDGLLSFPGGIALIKSGIPGQ